MLVRVPYVDKNDNAFYDIIKNESNFDSFFCYQIKNDLVYVNKKEKFDLKMPKLIKKLYNSAPEEHFIIVELVSDVMFVYINNGEKDFEYYEYSNTEQPLTQLFLSIFNGEIKYNIYIIENDDLRKILDSVMLTVSNFHQVNEDDILPVDVNITTQDLEEFFTKVSLEDKIKNKINEIKNKISNIILNNKIKINKRQQNNESNSKNIKILGVVAVGLLGYYLYSNDYLKNSYEYFFPEPVVVEEPILIEKPKIDIGKVNLMNNYNLFNYVKERIEKNDLQVLEFSNGKSSFVGNDKNIKKIVSKNFIDNNVYIVDEELETKVFKDEELNEFKNFESIDLENFIEFRSENQLILRLEEKNVIQIIRQLLCNDKLKYNINIYSVNDIYEIILYSDGVINDLSGKVEIKQTLIEDKGTFTINK